MDTKFIMEYSPFELMYEGIRHTTVKKYAKDRQLNLTTEQIKTLKDKLLEEENCVYEMWLRNLPHCAYFKIGEEDNEPHVFYDCDSIENGWYVGADALTAIARDLIYKVGGIKASMKYIKSGLYPALKDYTEELLILIDDYGYNGVDYDEGKRSDTETDSVQVLFGNGWRPTDVEDIFYQWPDTFEATKEFVSALEAEYVDWIENKIAEMEDALSELDKLDPDYHAQYEEIADNCAKEIARDMIYNAGMNERKYLHYFRDYMQALCTENGPDMCNRVLRILCQNIR